MQCASYVDNTENRCLNDTKGGSVFCEVHSSQFLKLYLDYKRIDIVKEIQDDMPINYYLKKLVCCEKAMKLRIEYREKAIAISARDIGHSMRIDILQERADKCVKNLEKLFSQNEIVPKNELNEKILTTEPQTDNVNESQNNNINTIRESARKIC